MASDKELRNNFIKNCKYIGLSVQDLDKQFQGDKVYKIAGLTRNLKFVICEGDDGEQIPLSLTVLKIYLNRTDLIKNGKLKLKPSEPKAKDESKIIAKIRLLHDELQDENLKKNHQLWQIPQVRNELEERISLLEKELGRKLTWTELRGKR